MAFTRSATSAALSVALLIALAAVSAEAQGAAGRSSGDTTAATRPASRGVYNKKYNNGNRYDKKKAPAYYSKQEEECIVPEIEVFVEGPNSTQVDPFAPPLFPFINIEQPEACDPHSKYGKKCCDPSATCVKNVDYNFKLDTPGAGVSIESCPRTNENETMRSSNAPKDGFCCLAEGTDLSGIQKKACSVFDSFDLFLDISALQAFNSLGCLCCSGFASSYFTISFAPSYGPGTFTIEDVITALEMLAEPPLGGRSGDAPVVPPAKLAADFKKMVGMLKDPSISLDVPADAGNGRFIIDNPVAEGIEEAAEFVLGVWTNLFIYAGYSNTTCFPNPLFFGPFQFNFYQTCGQSLRLGLSVPIPFVEEFQVTLPLFVYSCPAGNVVHPGPPGYSSQYSYSTSKYGYKG